MVCIQLFIDLLFYLFIDTFRPQFSNMDLLIFEQVQHRLKSLNHDVTVAVVSYYFLLVLIITYLIVSMLHTKMVPKRNPNISRLFSSFYTI